MSSATILLTGGAGLIGSATLRLLNQLGRTNILVVDKLGSSPWKWKNLRDVQFADYIEADQFMQDDCAYGLRWIKAMGVNTVIHLGAKSATTEADAAFLMRNNLLFSQQLAQWAEFRDVRFVYASSAATYGADTEMNDTEAAPYLESLRPLNPYGYSKHLFDLWMKRTGGLSGRNGAVGLKYFNVFGPPWERHKGEQASLVLKAYDSLRAGKPIELFQSARKDIPTSEIRRDFLAVDDAAKVTVWAAVGEGRKAAGLFNVGSGVASSFDDLARFTVDAFIAAHGSPQIPRHPEMRVVGPDPRAFYQFPYVRHVPMPEQLRSRYQYATRANVSKLRAAGYTDEFTPLDQAIARYVAILAKGEGGQ